MEALLNSTVISSAVTAFGAVTGTILVYILSRKRPKPSIFKRKSREEVERNRDNLTYAGYENLLKQMEKASRLKDEELERLYSVARDRETLIGILREKEVQLYKIIDEKDEQIRQLRRERGANDDIMKT